MRPSKRRTARDGRPRGIDRDERSGEPRAVVIPILGSPSKPWPSPGSDADRRWFRERPERSYRLRRAYPGEAPDDITNAWVIARQIRPGVRVRAVIGLNTPEPRDDEATARRLFEQATASGDARGIVAQTERQR